MKKLLLIFCMVVLGVYSNNVQAQTSLQYYYGMGGVQQLSIWQNIDDTNLLNVRVGYQDFAEENVSLSLGYGHLFGEFLPYLVFNKDVTSDLNNYSFTNGYYWAPGGRWDFAIGWTLNQHETLRDGTGTSEVPADTFSSWSQSYWFDVYYNLPKLKAQIGVETGVTSSGQWFWGVMFSKAFDFSKKKKMK
ncbi:hypothetical protein EI427_14080 [Flammeovirga pectinis]|uniref:Outer membrane protein beta-barrel domain-containing protein n=1 Tax=Flammeovirga pectinis TaxID=2494373 RepID=A0A3S9P547_9BACT|nr:hypothetical protein [Flammeovirga pectinis]AZQ63327.1 hypothetical protein EI427_14080 [Flammeovirga pectinis]